MEELEKGTIKYTTEGGIDIWVWDGKKWDNITRLTTQQKVLKWAADKELLEPENHTKQFIKLSEEVGELANAILKNNKEEQADAIGDCMIVLTILAEQLELDLFDCYDSAYEVIKNRTGKTIDGTFIKEEK